MRPEARACLIRALVSTPAALILAVVEAGAGHGSYFFARLFFPYTMLSTHAFGSITVPFMVLACLQTPLYGVLLAFAVNRNRKTPEWTALEWTALAIFAAHGVAVILCFAFPMPYFS